MLAVTLIDSTITLGQLLVSLSVVIGGAFTICAVIFSYVLANQRALLLQKTDIELLKAQCDAHDETAREFRTHQNQITQAIFDQVNEINTQLQHALGKIEGRDISR